MAARRGGLYSASGSTSGAARLSRRNLELGRACVARRLSRPGINLLFRGIAAYAARYNIEVMFGCASLPGADPNALALPLSYLYYYNLAPPALRPRALPSAITICG